jgi:hypothetical protein
VIFLSGKAIGSGYFGEWIEDEFGLPAYRYTCEQVSDPKASPETDRDLWRPATEHLHQVGNDRLVGIASNYGHIRVRQDEGSPKFLNDFDPDTSQYAGAFGYLTDGSRVLSTYYSGQEPNFDRVFGVGYYRKTLKKDGLGVDQIVFAPYGDDPILVSQVTIQNDRDKAVDLRWIEYWGCQQYQFSFKALMRSVVTKEHPNYYRRKLSKLFKHDIKITGDNRGLLDRFRFKGYSMKDKAAWRAFNLALRSGIGKKLTGGPVKSPVPEAVLEDESPPSVFLVSLDTSFDEYGTDATAFFGEGGPISPDGLQKPLSGNSSRYKKLGSAPLIEQCPVNLECRVVHMLDLGSHSLVIGRIEETHVSEDCLTDGTPDVNKIRPLTFVTSPAARYQALGELIAKAFSIGKEL